MTDFTGKWVLETVENMEAYAAADGMHWAMRIAAGAMGFGVGKHFFVIEMEPGGNELKLNEKNPMFERNYTITVNGAPHRFETPSDKEAEMTSVWDGDAIVHTLIKEKRTKTDIIRRSMVNGKMVMELTACGVTAKRTFKRQ